MSFLSSKQRADAIKQHLALDAALSQDEQALSDKLSLVRTTRECVANTISRLRSAEAGDCDADELMSIDTLAGEWMRQGLRHYPIVIGSGAMKVVLP